jgi:hypothetical protein
MIWTEESKEGRKKNNLEQGVPLLLREARHRHKQSDGEETHEG